MARYDFFPTGEWKPTWFDALLNSNLTYRVAYRLARLCPCQDVRSAGPDPNCPNCGGVGYVWDEVPLQTYQDVLVRSPKGSLDLSLITPGEKLSRAGVVEILEVRDQDGFVYEGVTVDEEGRPVFPKVEPPVGKSYAVTYRAPLQGRAHAQAIRSERMFLERGEVQAGDLQCTIPAHLEDLTTPNPAWSAKEHDRFIFLDLRRPVQQRMRRGLKEILTYTWRHGPSQARALVGGQEVTYREGEDYDIQDGRVVWRDGRGPAPREPYVLEYVASPEYYVFMELPQMRHPDGYAMPRRVILRQFELWPGRGK